jgi:hypothetical protein
MNKNMFYCLAHSLKLKKKKKRNKNKQMRENSITFARHKKPHFLFNAATGCCECKKLEIY